jgi:hypothetical protein
MYLNIMDNELSVAVRGDLLCQKLPHNLGHGHPVGDCLYFQSLMKGFRNINRQPLGFIVRCACTSIGRGFQFLHLNSPVFDNGYRVIFCRLNANLVPAQSQMQPAVITEYR